MIKKCTNKYEKIRKNYVKITYLKVRDSISIYYITHFLYISLYMYIILYIEGADMKDTTAPSTAPCSSTTPSAGRSGATALVSSY